MKNLFLAFIDTYISELNFLWYTLKKHQNSPKPLYAC